MSYKKSSVGTPAIVLEDPKSTFGNRIEYGVTEISFNESGATTLKVIAIEDYSEITRIPENLMEKLSEAFKQNSVFVEIENEQGKKEIFNKCVLVDVGVSDNIYFFSLIE